MTHDMKEAFEGLDDALGTSYEEPKQIVKVEKKPPPAVIEKKESNLVSIDDEEYIAEGMKNLIESTNNVVNKLDKSLKIGTDHRKFEVYSELVNSVTGQYKELRHLRESAAKLKHDQTKKVRTMNDIGKNEVVMLSPEALSSMIENASKNSELNRIEAKFTIEDEEEH